jgi:hypothetical protein
MVHFSWVVGMGAWSLRTILKLPEALVDGVARGAEGGHQFIGRAGRRLV